MSLIFQSLQKLKSNLNPSESGQGSPGSENGQTPFKPFVWLRPILIGLVLVVGLGCGAVYAVQYLKAYSGINQDKPGIRTLRHEIRPDIETPPFEPAAEPHRAGNAPFPKPQPMMNQSTKGKVQFYPPEQKTTQAASVPAALVADQSDPLPAAPDRIIEQAAAMPQALGPLAKDKGIDKPFAVKQPHSDAEMEAVAHVRRKALERTAHIGRLVRRIEQALAGAADRGSPEKLLNQLARLKGENHPYVMKLRAYMNFQRGAYSAAEADLKKVIAVHPDDLEAGINMALIEIQAQRYAEAMARLKRLRHLYPEQATVADLIKGLK